MNNEQLNKQVEEIEKLVADGKTVKLSLQKDKKSASLKIDKKGVRRDSKKSPDEGNFGLNINAAAAKTFALDLGANDISDAQINAKIKKASDLAKRTNIGAAAGVLPKVTLSRDDARAVWILENTCSYTPDKLNPSRKITAPQGFETDLSSIPRIFWSIIEPAELSLAAPLFHDLIYRRAGKLKPEQLDPFDEFVFERRQVDDLFFELMTKAGIPSWKRKAAYWAVRGFAAFAWKLKD